MGNGKGTNGVMNKNEEKYSESLPVANEVTEENIKHNFQKYDFQFIYFTTFSVCIKKSQYMIHIIKVYTKTYTKPSINICSFI